MSKYCLAYVTTSGKDEARSIARELLESKLVACVNIFDNIESHFIWKEKLCSENETIFFAKMPSENYLRFEEKVSELHSYDNPCILKLDITEGKQTFLSWVSKATN